MLLLTAFSPGYLLRQAAGQWRIVRRRRKLTEVLPSLAPEQRAKIVLVRDAAAFGRDRVGLKAGRSFTTYYDTGGRPVSYVVSACPKDKLEPVTWWFPIAGRVPYKGYFKLEDARAEKARLEARGLDVSLDGVAAYSTLGWFADPLFSSLLAWPDFRLAELTIHELVHGTVYSKRDGDFNEGLASFIGGEAALRFLKERDGPEAPSVREAEALRDDDRRVEVLLRGVQAKLKELYASGLPLEEKLRRRETAFAEADKDFKELRPALHSSEYDGLMHGFNNAVLLANLRYEGGDLFEKAFREEDGDFARFLRRAKKAAKAKEPLKAMAEPAAP